MAEPANKKDKIAINISREEMGKADTLRYNILTHVVNESYELATKELNSFLETESPYPNFKDRLGRYVTHATDLVHAIKAKRKFPGMNSLTYAKQQELSDKFMEHFDELKYVLKKIEKIQNDMKIEDIRSTVIVLKALINAVFAVAVVGWILELSGGLFKTGLAVIEDFFLYLTDWVFQILGL
jgi:hypothetical protein